MHSNPSDYFMKILSINYPKTSDDDKYVKQLTDGYAKFIQSDILYENTSNKYPQLTITENGMAPDM